MHVVPATMGVQPYGGTVTSNDTADTANEYPPCDNCPARSGGICRILTAASPYAAYKAGCRSVPARAANTARTAGNRARNRSQPHTDPVTGPWSDATPDPGQDATGEACQRCGQPCYWTPGRAGQQCDNSHWQHAPKSDAHIERINQASNARSKSNVVRQSKLSPDDIAWKRAIASQLAKRHQDLISESKRYDEIGIGKTVTYPSNREIRVLLSALIENYPSEAITDIVLDRFERLLSSSREQIEYYNESDIDDSDDILEGEIVTRQYRELPGGRITGRQSISSGALPGATYNRGITSNDIWSLSQKRCWNCNMIADIPIIFPGLGQRSKYACATCIDIARSNGAQIPSH